MRNSSAAGLALLALCLGAASVACSDLFHSTTDVLTGCELGLALCAATDVDAGPDASDFCAWSPAEAKQHAAHACAWLGACQSPMGRNAFGSCMFEALLAYDCASNPSHRVKGATHDLWARLDKAQTCDAVSGSILPGMPACQPGDYTACVGAPNADGLTTMVRVECSDGSVHGENCALWAESCSPMNGGAACSGPVCGDGGLPISCIAGTQLRCESGGAALAFDCAGNGAQACAGFPEAANVQWVACVPDDGGPDAACVPTQATACAGDVASSCPSGIREGLDCGNLLGASGACTSGTLNPPFDWTSPCAVTPPQCVADACSDGGVLANGTLTGCVRGATFSVDCAAQGLGPCQLVTTDVGTEQRPACAPP